MTPRPLTPAPRRERLFDLAPVRVRPAKTCETCGARREEGQDDPVDDCLHELERSNGAPLERYPATCCNAPDPEHDPIPY